MSELINNSGNLVYLGEETRKSQKGNDYTLVTIGDSVEMQRHNFFKDEKCETNDLKVGQPVDILLNLDTEGFNQRINLKKVLPHKV